MTISGLISIIAILAAVAAIVGWIAARSETSRMRTEQVRLSADNARLTERVRALTADNERLSQQLGKELHESEERFRAIASRILMNNSEALRVQSKNTLSEVLRPMQEDLEQFRRLFTDRYYREASERFSLGERVRELMELNRTVGQETRRLSDALRGNAKAQGDWGEIILDNILDRAGFRRGVDYSVQESFQSSDGSRLRPDVVFNYSDGRRLVIDSKVSIQDFLAMLNSGSDEERSAHAKAHVASIRNHINELARKSYQKVVGEGSVDFVLMFVPHEGAFMAAMDIDPTLWQTAYDKHVIIISPTHLTVILKLVEQMWRIDRQNRNAREIARRAGLMADKFRLFLEDMEAIGRSLGAARSAYDSAVSRLTTGQGNLVGRANDIAALGAPPSKPFPTL